MTVPEQEYAAFGGLIAVVAGGMMFISGELFLEGIIMITYGLVLCFSHFPKKGSV